MAVVSGRADDKEYGCFIGIQTNTFEDITTNKSGRRYALLDAPLALALYKTGPPILPNRITEKETKHADAGENIMLTGRQIATMI